MLKKSSTQSKVSQLSTKQQRQKMYALSIGSSIASMIAKFTTHPIDTIKAKIQVNRMKMRNVSDIKIGNAIQMMKKTYRNEKIPGFFRGVTISALGSTVAFSCYMSMYQFSKKKLLKTTLFKDHHNIVHLVSGFMAEMTSCAFWLPIDVIKERLQVQSELKIYTYAGPRDAAKKINRVEGVVGLYRAYGATLLFFGPWSAIFFVSFQKMKDWVTKDRKKPTLIENIFCSSLASAFAGYITTPLQIVKLRMQIQRADIATHGGTLQKSVFGYRHAFHGLSKMFREQGFFSLFKGGFVRICFVIPITTISMSLSQFFKQRIIEYHILQNWI